LYDSVAISSFRQNKENEMANKEDLIRRLTEIVSGEIIDKDKIRKVSLNRDGSLAIETKAGSLRIKIGG
jgi:hypothetical protein